jgi:hypothetical protein
MKDEFRRGPRRPEREPFSGEVEGTVSQYLLNPRGEAGIGFGTVNDLGRSIAVAMLSRSTGALAVVEPPPAKPKKHPEDRKVREEGS